MARVHVLVVDDVAPLRSAFQSALEAFGFTVATAADGRAALEEMRRRVPDLVLIDLEMPVLDGWQLVRALRQDPRTHDIPAVAMTGRDDVPDERATSAGFDALLRKPFTPDELLHCIARLTLRVDEPPGPGPCCRPPRAA